MPNCFLDKNRPCSLECAAYQEDDVLPECTILGHLDIIATTMSSLVRLHKTNEAELKRKAAVPQSPLGIQFPGAPKK